MSSEPRRRRKEGGSAATSPSALVIHTRAAKERVVLAAAADLLARHGPAHFNVRDVAKAVGASTMVIYTLFGGRDGLVDAVRRDAMDRLADAFEEVAHPDSLAGLARLAGTYRGFALANREYYFALAVTRTAAGRVREERAFQLLVSAVRGCMERGLIVRGPPEETADALWGLVHGIVSLELSGHFASSDAAEAVLARAGHAMLRGLRAS